MFRCQRTDAPAFRIAVFSALLAVAVGCSTQEAAHESMEAVKHENWDAAVYHYLELVAKHPDEAVAARLHRIMSGFNKPVVVRYLGDAPRQSDDRVQYADSLDQAARLAARLCGCEPEADRPVDPGWPPVQLSLMAPSVRIAMPSIPHCRRRAR